MAFTEFYCQNGGSNVNAGSTTNNTSAYTATNGNWSTTTNNYIPTDGSTPASSVSTGDWASIYIDGASLAVYIARVTSVDAGVNGTIHLSSSVNAGTAPVTSVNTRTIKVGGAWLGPNGASGFPVTLSSLGSLNDASGHRTRVNFKNDQTYSITASISATGAGTCVLQGYTGSVNDGGRATLDGSTNAINILTISGTSQAWIDFIFVSSATSGTSNNVAISSNGFIMIRCVSHGARNDGFTGSAIGTFIECESYDNNKANTASKAGFNIGAQINLVRCIAHDNTGSNTAGFRLSSASPSNFIGCIADTNGGVGLSIIAASNGQHVITNCDLYNNGSDGIKVTSANGQTIAIQNCNFVKNTGFGINDAATLTETLYVDNCGYGSGTQVNVGGDSTGAIVETSKITYPSGATPWVDPANGDFRINLPEANFAGRGVFTETAASYSGTVGYPDVGAAQSATGGGGTFSKETSHGVAQ